MFLQYTLDLLEITPKWKNYIPNSSYIQTIESRVQSPFSELPTPFWRTWWNQLFGQYLRFPS